MNRNNRSAGINRKFTLPTLLVLSTLAQGSWASDIARLEKFVHLGIPTIAVLSPDQLNVGVLSGPGFFGRAMTKRNLPHFLSMTTAIQQAHPETKGNILFVRVGIRASIFPFTKKITNLSINKIGDVPDIRDIGQVGRFRVRETARDLSARLTYHLSRWGGSSIEFILEAHAASTKAFDNAAAGAPLTLVRW